MTPTETIQAIIASVTYVKEGHKFLNAAGNDIKRKRSHGYWTVRVRHEKKYIEAYCHRIIYFLETGLTPTTIKFRDDNKDNLDADNLIVTNELPSVVRKAKAKAKEPTVANEVVVNGETLLKMFIRKHDLPKVRELLESAGLPYSFKQKEYVIEKAKEAAPIVETSAMALFPIDCYFLDWSYS